VTDQNKIVVFGAGRIGRSFIGQLFSQGGWEVVFVDTDTLLIDELNRKGRYRVIIKEKEESILWVEKVRGVPVTEENRVTVEICNAGLVAVSVGMEGIPTLIPLLAKGLIERHRHNPEPVIDIILAENMRNAAQYFEVELRKLLPAEFPLGRLVGLVETSIGKMVPIMRKKDLMEDRLQVFAEAYNTLILDKKAFKNPVPGIEGLAPKENMKAWVDRKLFIHNLGHACAAYLGYLFDPGMKYIYEVMEIPELSGYVRRVMLQSAGILLQRYPGEFTPESLEEHIDDLLMRFGNRELGDTVFRVGCDLPRKLGPDDRLAGAIRLAKEMKMPCDLILFTLVCACRFRATDENGEMLPSDREFTITAAKGIRSVMTEICGFGDEDADLIENAIGIDRELVLPLKHTIPVC